MDINSVFEIVKFFENSSLGEMNLEMEGVKLGMKKGQEYAVSYVAPTKVEQVVSAPVEAKPSSAPATSVAGQVEIKAPLVGTFYKAASPEDAPFVTIGQSVKKGDVVGIIEAMKLMNEITAPEDGIVEAIYVEDGDMVDFNKTLIALRK